MGKNKRELERLEERADALPGVRIPAPEDMSYWERRMHAVIGDLVFVPPGYWTEEEAESVDNNPEYKAVLDEYKQSLP